MGNRDIEGKFTISFDVSSFFTNIPLYETLDLKISRKELKELFVFSTSKINFIFDGVIYDQIDGIAMGSPLAPTLANLFMGYNEGKWLTEFGGGGGGGVMQLASGRIDRE